MLFTQEIKDKWVSALKSGAFTQGFCQLEQSINSKRFHCCIGVLGVIYKIHNPYLFLEETIGKLRTEELYRANDKDRFFDDGLPKDYSNVIPLIESLPVNE